MTAKTCPTESEEQQAVMSWSEWAANRMPEAGLLFHIPNGGARTAVTGARMKAEGVKKGVPDLMLPVARGGYHGLFIEMKRRQGGRVSPEQAGWLRNLEVMGYYTAVCFGADDAIKVIDDYLRGNIYK